LKLSLKLREIRRGRRDTALNINAPGMADMPGEITGGTECYGRHYSCDDPLTSLALMFLKTFQVAFSRCARPSHARIAARHPHHQLPIESSC
jgi:hypothetical protein